MEHMSFIHMISNTPRYAVIALYPVAMDFWAMPTHNMHPMETLKQFDIPTKVHFKYSLHSIKLCCLFGDCSSFSLC